MAPKRASAGATKQAHAKKADTIDGVTKTSRTRRSVAESTASSASKSARRSSTRKQSNTSTKAAANATDKALSKTTRKAATKGPKESVSSASSSKTARGRAPAKKAAEPAKTANQANIKRKRARSPSPSTARLESAPKLARPMKKAKVAAEPKPKPKVVLTTPPDQKLNIYVNGEGSGGELGLGAKLSSIDVQRPRFNPLLAPDAAGVVQIACGGMHAIALTHDNKILTWGVNDGGALGRPTPNEDAKMKDVDTDDNRSDAGSDTDSDSGLSPKEATPTAIPSTSFPEGTKFVQVAAGDSTSFALTDDGLVYGWGVFRDVNGTFGFALNADKTVTEIQTTPKLVSGLKNIVKIDAGADHAVALDKDGNVFAWGTGANGQLARRTMERRKYDSLKPHPVALPRKKISSIYCGQNHTFAVTKTGEAYGWGLNTFAQCGIINKDVGKDGASIIKPEKIKLFKKPIKMVTGGNHNSLACTEDGDLLTFGKCQSGLSGTLNLPADDPEVVVKNERGEASILLKPLKVNEVPGKTVFVASGGEHDIAITEEGKAYGWGFNGTYQLGLGDAGNNLNNVLHATLIENKAIREQKLVWAGAGGQYSMYASVASGHHV